MKKVILLFLIINILFFNNIIRSQLIESDDLTSLNNKIFETLSSENGILSKVYKYYQSKDPWIYNERLLYHVDIDLDTTINTVEINKIQELIKWSFNKARDVYPDSDETKKGIPDLPILKEQNIRKYFDDPYIYFAKQTILISKSKAFITVNIDTAIFYKISSENVINDRVKIPNTAATLSGILELPRKINYNFLTRHKYITNLVDSLIQSFSKQHTFQKKFNDPALKANYVQQNEDIFKKYIKPPLEKIASPEAVIHMEKFLTRFLGNEYAIFYDHFPIYNPEFDVLETDRIQDANVEAFENYSLFLVNQSEKKSNNTDFGLPTFKHYLTITDRSLYDIFITYPSTKYSNDLFDPLIAIFDSTLGKKFYHDIIRFFYGFTTALTIQDFNWINDHYLDLAIRNYYPSISDINSRRLVSIGEAEITRGYKSLDKKGREVYVTLNEGVCGNERLSTAWILFHQFSERSLSEISLDNNLSNSFIQNPAFILKVKMDQRWRTIDRRTQSIKLNDSTRVDFTLLCMNIDRLNNWLSQNSFDRLTIFTLANYFQDLFNDMYPNEKVSFERDYQELYQYLEKNKQLLNRIPIITVNEEVFQKSKDSFLRPYREILPILSSRERFETILSDIRRFYISTLRKDIHIRRFLFNICYIKIFSQISKVDGENRFFIKPTKEKEFYNLILGER